jgi:hypothetical protein
LFAGLDAHVAVARALDAIRDHLHFFADFIEAAAHEPLDREDRVFGIGDGLPLGDLSHQALAGLAEGNDRGSNAATFRVLDDGGLIAFHHRDNGVCGAQVDADDFAHPLSMKSE